MSDWLLDQVEMVLDWWRDCWDTTVRPGLAVTAIAFLLAVLAALYAQP